MFQSDQVYSLKNITPQGDSNVLLRVSYKIQANTFVFLPLISTYTSSLDTLAWIYNSHNSKNFKTKRIKLKWLEL